MLMLILQQSGHLNEKGKKKNSGYLFGIFLLSLQRPAFKRWCKVAALWLQSG